MTPRQQRRTMFLLFAGIPVLVLLLHLAAPVPDTSQDNNGDQPTCQTVAYDTVTGRQTVVTYQPSSGGCK